MRWYSLLCLGLLATVNFTGCSGKGGNAAKDVPGTPQGAVEVVMQELAEGKWGVIWKALPESYQGDVEHLIEHGAEHMDAEIYNKSMVVYGKVVQILTEKQDMILGFSELKPFVEGGSVNKADVKEAMTAVAKMLNSLQQDIKTKDDFAKLDVEKYLGTVGEGFKSLEPIIAKNDPTFKEKLEAFKKPKVTAKDVTTDSANVEIVIGKETKKLALTKVEGKWIPADMAKSWKDDIKKLDHNLHEGAENLTEEQKTQIKNSLTEAETLLNSILSAKDQAEFDTAAKAAAEKFMPLIFSLAAQKKAVPLPGN